MRLLGAEERSVATGEAGTYAFSHVPPGEWTIEPRKQGEIANGATALDAAYVLQAVDHRRDLDALQQHACDADGNGRLDQRDAEHILDLSAGLLARLPIATLCGSDWVFAPAATASHLLDPPTGDAQCQHGIISLEPLQHHMSQQDFEAVLFGDCTGSWHPQPTPPPVLTVGGPNDPTVHIGAPRGPRQGRMLLPLVVSASTPFSAVTLELEYDATQLRPVRARPRGRGLGRLSRIRADSSGSAIIVIAARRPVEPERFLTLLVDFDVLSPAATLSTVEVRRFSLDEGPAFAGTSAAIEP